MKDLTTKSIPAPHRPTDIERFKGGFAQAWRENRPDRSVWGKLQGWIVATALVGIVAILALIAVVAAKA